MSLASLIHQGGIVMIPLLLGSILAIAVILERVIFYARLETGGESFREKLRDFIRKGLYDQAIEWLSGLRGPVPVTARAALEMRGQPVDTIEATMAARTRLEIPSLRRFLGLLDTIVTAAPLVGLLGTITGMMGVFHTVAERLARNPGADTTQITAGIGEALITTATGILIAVVSLIFHNLFQSVCDVQMDTCEAVAAETVAAMQANRPANSKPTLVEEKRVPA